MSKLADYISQVVPKIENGTMPELSGSYEILSKDSEIFSVIKSIVSIKDRLSDIDLKRIYGWTILGVLALWVIFVIFVCIAYMFQNCPNLSDNVLITLLTTTTVNILILPTIVLKYLFPHNKEHDK